MSIFLPPSDYFHAQPLIPNKQYLPNEMGGVAVQACSLIVEGPFPNMHKFLVFISCAYLPIYYITRHLIKTTVCKIKILCYF